MVELLKPLWEPLSEERSRELAFRWVDMTVRRMLAESFAKAGRPHQAGVLRELPPIRDMPALREILRSAEPQQYRFQDLILGIVRSTPFQMRTAGVQ